MSKGVQHLPGRQYFDSCTETAAHSFRSALQPGWAMAARVTAREARVTARVTVREVRVMAREVTVTLATAAWRCLSKR